MSKNRFAGLQAVKKIQENKEIKIVNTLKSEESKQIPTKTNLISKEDNSATMPRRGRPNGKRSNSEFQQVTAYVRRETYRKVSIKLIDQEVKGEFSELIEELLQEWLEK